jgi:preprotein translocase subunit SecD
VLRKRLLLITVILITVLAIIIDWPSVPVKFNLGPLKVDTTLRAPTLDLTGLGIPLRRDTELKLGLDLQGGTRLVLQADMEPISAEDRDDALDSAKEVVERRVNLFGVSEPVVQSSRVGEDYRVVVELPGVKDVNEAKELVGKTAQLQFREYSDPTVATSSAAPTLQNTRETGVTGKDLKSARVDFGQGGTAQSQPVVAFTLTDEGKQKFADLTTRLVGQPLAVFLDDQPVAAPTVNSPITEGNGIISGGFTTESARELAVQLNAGALPVSIDVVEERTVGASLGQESINKSLLAGAIGLAIVCFFMISYYGIPGILASMALLFYTIYTLALFKLIPVTLTLAGIAGFILSIGMAVDANVLIFERMREEERNGKSRNSSIEIGFARAWSSIRDSNVSSLITAAILYWFGTGAVRGFALTLAIGILVSMFTAITLTRNFLRIFYHERKVRG